MQPERRVLARDPDGVVLAHVGIRRMFITVGGRDVLVGDTGLVAVSPRLQGSGRGRELMERTHAVLDGLAVPYGFLGAGENRIPFYAKLGWHEFPEVVGTFSAFTAEGAGITNTEQGGWMVRPVAAALEDWPAGPIWLNGQRSRRGLGTSPRRPDLAERPRGLEEDWAPPRGGPMRLNGHEV